MKQLLLTEKDREQIAKAAHEDFKRFHRGVGGHMLTEWDSIESWVIEATASFLSARCASATPADDRRADDRSEAGRGDEAP